MSIKKQNIENKTCIMQWQEFECVVGQRFNDAMFKACIRQAYCVLEEDENGQFARYKQHGQQSFFQLLRGVRFGNIGWYVDTTFVSAAEGGPE